MKDKIITLIIGVLIGAIITAGGFLLFGQNNKTVEGKDLTRRGQMQEQMGNYIPGEKTKGTPPDGENMVPTDKKSTSVENNDNV